MGLWDSPEVCLSLIHVLSLTTFDRLNSLGHWSKDLPLISEAEETVRLLGGAQNILECLLDSLKATISAVNSALRPFQNGKGLESLPNEVLSMIFKCAGSRSSLSRVCHRFRQVALDIPQLWSFISNGMKSMHQVHSSLKESKASGLYVDLHLEPNDPPLKYKLDLLSVLDAALMHVDRWESLRFSAKFNDCWLETESCIRRIDERLKNIDLPRLRSLSIEYSDEFDDVDVDVDIYPLDDPNSAVHFHRTWSLPKLHELYITNFIPVSFAAPALSSLSMELEVTDRDEPSALRLIEFLSSIPQLEDLYLTLGILNSAEDLPPLVLPHLKSFRLDVKEWMIPHVALFTKALITPIIHSMHLHVECLAAGEPDLSGWLEAFLCHNKYPTLKELTFDFFDYESRLTYEIPFEKLPTLETLTLDTAHSQANFSYDNMENNGPIPPLRSIHLLGDIDSRWRYWLERVKKKMQVQGKLADFERLTICAPDVLNANGVRDMFPGKHIVWADSPDRVRVFE